MRVVTAALELVSERRVQRVYRVAGVGFEVLAGADDGEGARRAVASWLALHGGATGAGLYFMRKLLGLTGVELGRLLHRRTSTISRWENDERPIPNSAWVVVGAMVLERCGLPGRTEQLLRNARERGPRPESVQLIVSEV